MLRTFLLAILAAFAALAQQTDTSVTISASGPLASKAATKVSWKNSQVTFSLGSCTIDGTAACALPVSITNRTGYLPAALQFDLAYGPDITAATVAAGPAATAAQKTITCAPITGGVRCVVSGLNALTMSDGVVAIATVQTSVASPDAATVALLGAVTASVKGTQIASIVSLGGGVVTMPALLATVNCAQPDIWTDQAVSCSVSLNKPAAADVSIGLTSDSPLVTLPASVSIPKGATSATFTATGQAL